MLVAAISKIDLVVPDLCFRGTEPLRKHLLRHISGTADVFEMHRLVPLLEIANDERESEASGLLIPSLGDSVVEVHVLLQCDGTIKEMRTDVGSVSVIVGKATFPLVVREVA